MMPDLPDHFWPEAQLGSALDYSWDTFRDLAPIRDAIASVAVSIQPSGSGELAVTSVSVDRFLIMLNLSGGVAGRLYFIQITVSTLAGRTFVYVIGLQISPLLAVPPIEPPASPFMGAAFNWPSGVNLLRMNAVLGALSAG
jgi:hypothetical protein